MSGNYTEELGAVKKDLNSLKQDFSNLVKSVTSDAKDNAAELRASAERKAEEAKVSAVDAGTKGKAKASKAVRENPVSTLLVTAGLGLIAGALIARK